MKTIRIKKIFAWVLCLCMLTAMLSLFPAVSAASDVSIQNGTGTREPLRVGNSFAYRAKVNGGFTAFAFRMPTWEKTGESCTLYLFQWNESFDKTVAGEPIAKKTFSPMVDGAANTVTFAEQPAGEYLFYIDNATADTGVWTNTNPTGSKGFMYVNGIEQRGEPELLLTFTNPPEEPFGVCEPSADIMNPKIPYTPSGSEGVTNIVESMGVRLNLNEAFSGIQFKMATYHATDMEITVSVYAWKGSYEATVKENPAATDRFVMVDNAWQGIRFDKLPAGDYLIIAHDPSAGPAMYCYPSAEGFEGYVYQDGYCVANITSYPEVQVVFSADREDEIYFLPCTAPQDGVTGDHVAPPQYVIPEDSLLYTHPVMPDTWVFTDGLGRVSLTNAEVGDPRDDKTLAMFFWTWHVDNFINQNVVNLQKLSEQYPEAMRDWDNPLWSELGSVSHWWNESIYGFYRGNDTWVLRKQAELLANAGVDVIFTDNTNGTSTWRAAYTPLYETWDDAQKNGAVNVPKVSYMLPFWDKGYTNAQLQMLYLDIYHQNKFPNLWFYWDEKPMLMAMGESVNPNNSLAEKEIADFFTFRAGQPGYKLKAEGDKEEKTEFSTWGWLSTYPQDLYYKNNRSKKEGKVEQMTVGIAMNHDYVLGELAAMSGNNIMGRSYTSIYQDRFFKDGKEASKWGYNFAEQFNYALEVDPQVIFVTGWNEFRVGRYESWPEGNPPPPSAVENAFPDQYNDEFSRDIEPTKGDLKDHYYYQLVNFVRQYKGARPIPTPSGAVTIDLNGNETQWENVAPYYAAYIGNTGDRDAKGYGDLVYTETSGRNDIIGAQIARDDEYVYFHVECAEDITPYTDSLWMTLYIDSDQANQGWETFEYVVNKSAASADTVVLEKFTGNGYESTKVADCTYKVDGRYMTVKIAKSDLGLTGHDYTINFAWTDNVHDEGDTTTFSGDIMDFYISGDVAPGARFKFSYISTAENASSAPNENETDGTSADTTADTATADTTADTDTADTGCASAVTSAMGMVALTSLAGASLLCKKKKED